MKLLPISGGLLAVLAGVGWVGLRVRPAPFPAITEPAAPPNTVHLPPGLPAPVERFYRQVYGENIPLITSAVITGRGTIRPVLGGPTLPVRFRFTHQAGQNYRHYIEATFFGLPVLKVNEYYVDGQERMELPWTIIENNPKLDQAGNLGMWAESLLWLPAILLTDPRVHWEPVDNDTALLVVPFGQSQERFVVRFDPASGQVQHWEVMRYKNGTGEKVLWIDGAWLDEGSPWAVFNAEEVVYNLSVEVSMAVKGP